MRLHTRRAWLASCAVVLASIAVTALVYAKAAAAAPPLGTITEFSAGLYPGSAPRSLVRGPDGNLWFTDDGSTKAIGRITPGGTITEFTAGLDPGSFPGAIVVGPDGNLWFSDQGSTKAIGRITTAGAITEFSAGLQSGGRVVSPVAGPDGNVWFVDSASHEAIGKVTPGGAITEFSEGLPPVFFGTEDLVAGPDGNLWFGDTFGPIGRITTSGAITMFSEGLPAGSDTTGIVAGPDGNLWFGDNGTSRAVGRITPSGAITVFPTGCEGMSSCGVDGPVAGSDGNLYFAEPERGSIARITSGGAISRFAAGPFGRPQDPVLGPDGNIWFSDLSGGERLHPGEPTQNAIGRVTPGGTLTAYSAGLQLVGGGVVPIPNELVAGPDGNVWFLDRGTIGRITTAEPPPAAVPTAAPTPTRCKPGQATFAGRTLRLKITCSGSKGATGRLRARLTTRERKQGRKVIALFAGRHVRRSAETITVGATSTRVTAGESVTVDVKLNRPGRRLLARFHRLPATLTITFDGASSRRAVMFTQRERRHGNHH